MKRSHLTVVLSVAGLLLGPVVGIGAPSPNPQSLIFSLDDLPTSPTILPPYTITVGAVGWGAEDPFGTGLFIPGPLAPSPSIPVVAPTYGPTRDSTILQTGTISGSSVPDQHLGPVINFGFLQHGYINALSAYHESAADEIPLSFSVDRISMGMPNTAVNGQALLNQHPGDVFRAMGTYPNPIQYVGLLPPDEGYVSGALPTPGTGSGNNTLVVDESQLTLTAGAGPGVMTPPNVAALQITPASHDNLDAMDFYPLDHNGDGMPDGPGVFSWLFSVNPDEAAEFAALTTGAFSAADVFAVMPIFNLSMTAMPASSSGLDAAGPNTDDIDALHLLFDDTGPCALFSLGPGSESLLKNNLSAADIFFTDFNGSFTTYLTAADIGLLPDDNVDALPEPATLTLLALGGLAILRRRLTTEYECRGR